MIRESFLFRDKEVAPSQFVQSDYVTWAGGKGYFLANVGGGAGNGKVVFEYSIAAEQANYAINGVPDITTSGQQYMIIPFDLPAGVIRVRAEELDGVASFTVTVSIIVD